MKPTTLEKKLGELEARQRTAEERLAELRDKATRETDVDAMIALQGQLTAAQGEVAACTSAITAAERARAEAEAAERAAAEQHWREKLHPQAVKEIDQALEGVLDTLRELRRSWDRYCEVQTAWAERWAAEGRFQPGVPHVGAETLGDYLNIAATRTGGSEAQQAYDQRVKQLLRGPAEVEKR